MTLIQNTIFLGVGRDIAVPRFQNLNSRIPTSVFLITLNNSYTPTKNSHLGKGLSKLYSQKCPIWGMVINKSFSTLVFLTC